MNQSPVILFSHIPLYRPEGTGCGPLRERGTIRQGFGTGYQNILGKEASNFLLLKLKPTLILRYTPLFFKVRVLAHRDAVEMIMIIANITTQLAYLEQCIARVRSL